MRVHIRSTKFSNKSKVANIFNCQYFPPFLYQNPRICAVELGLGTGGISSSMAEMSRKIDVEKLKSYGDDLVAFLKDERDVNYLKLCVEQSNALRSHCRTDYVTAQSSLKDFQKKIDLCKQKTDAAKAEVAEDAEIDILQKELEEELQREKLLKEELRVVTNEIHDLERQRISVEDRRQVLKKLEQEEMRAQMKLSMYASVTKVIPNLDHEGKISGNIVDKDKGIVEKFEFDPLLMTNYDSCSSIWKMITQ